MHLSVKVALLYRTLYLQSIQFTLDVVYIILL